MGDDRISPTVLVARKVAPGKENEFAHWMARVTQEAQRATGHVASDVQRPDSTHPNEWMIVYRFEDMSTLDAWLESDVRSALIEEGADLILEPPRTQVLASRAHDPGVRMVTSYLLKEDAEAMHRAVHEDIMIALRDFQGFRELEILDAVPGVQNETVVILTFDDEESLRQWLESETRLRLLHRLESHIEGTYTTNVLGGFAGWFRFDDTTEPSRWKQAAIVLAALFPISLTVTFLRSLLWPDAPLIPAVFLGNVIGVALLTWIVMPPLTRRLSNWLRS